MSDYILRAVNINKGFPGVQALSNVCIDLKKGEVLGLVGENGAGKSTLIKCFGGIHRIDSGEIYIKDELQDIKTPFDSLKLGIGIIHQELVLSEQLTVADNIFMGREHTKKFTIDRGKTIKEAQEVLDRVSGGAIKATTIISDLSTAEKQLVEISKALTMNAEILIMDEPTAMLTNKEVINLFALVKQLKTEGISIIFISHRLNELFEITDRITVMRDGESICTTNTSQTKREDLIKNMVGRTLDEFISKESHPIPGDVVLEAKDFCRVDRRVMNASFNLKKGEIIGFAGLVGAGRTELMKMIFGIDEIAKGELYLHGKQVHFKNALDAMSHGIGYVTENRKQEGLFLHQSVGFNLTLGVLDDFIKHGRVNFSKENRIIDEYVDELDIKVSSKRQLVGNLSGGNQQKVVLAKWLAISPSILILDEPTRGIDVGAKSEIYEIINNLLTKGISIIVISSEMPELINLCDRVYVMYEGKIKACLQGNDINQETILSYALEA